jgi:hypothetical protein
MEQRWNDTDRGKPKDLERNLSQCYFVCPDPRGEKPATNHLSYGTPDLIWRK